MSAKKVLFADPPCGNYYGNSSCAPDSLIYGLIHEYYKMNEARRLCFREACGQGYAALFHSVVLKNPSLTSIGTKLKDLIYNSDINKEISTKGTLCPIDRILRSIFRDASDPMLVGVRPFNEFRREEERVCRSNHTIT